jgi:hypothetical protein
MRRNTATKFLQPDPAVRVRDAYQDAVLAMHQLARVLEAEGLDNFALASRTDADAYHVRMKLALRQLEIANDNGGSDATH